jgi:hypothetical protein
MLENPWVKGDEVGKKKLAGTIKTIKQYNVARKAGKIDLFDFLIYVGETMRKKDEVTKATVFNLFDQPPPAMATTTTSITTLATSEEDPKKMKEKKKAEKMAKKEQKKKEKEQKKNKSSGRKGTSVTEEKSTHVAFTEPASVSKVSHKVLALIISERRIKIKFFP